MPEKKEEETVTCPNYIKINGEYLCKEYRCPIDNADYGPGFNFESMTKCRTDGVITLSQAKDIGIPLEGESEKSGTSRLERMNARLAELNSERAISSQVSATEPQ